MSRSMEVSVDFTVERDGDDVELVICGNWLAGSSGCRRGDPGNWTPDEPPEVEIVSIKCVSNAGAEWTGELTTQEQQRVEELLCECANDNAEEDDGPDPDDYAREDDYDDRGDCGEL